ncbi:MAG: hypothetical protein ACYTDY_00205 [Planctomycetota bacterium]|jgi:hypothetical protein
MRILRFAFTALGVGIVVWSLFDPRFRDSEGALTNPFCLALSFGAAVAVFGHLCWGPWRRAGLWLTLAIVGQAIALQMTKAGPIVLYQHPKSISQLLADSHPLMFAFLAVQAVVVAVGLIRRGRAIGAWLAEHVGLFRGLALAAFFALTAAKLKRSSSEFAYDVALATFLLSVNLGNIVLLAWAIPREKLSVVLRWLDGLLGGSGTRETARLDRFAWVAALLVFVVSAFLCVVVYERHPHVPDEVVHIWHAEYLSKGWLTTPAPAVPEAFSFYLMPPNEGTWHSIVNPGWQAVLAFGSLLGVAWLVNPLLGGLNVLLAYLLFQKLFTLRSARLGTLLLCLSPWNVFLNMSFMSHTIILTCVLVAWLSLMRAARTGQARYGFLAGLATALLALTRPLDGVIFGGLAGLRAIGVGGKRLKLAPLASFVIGTLLLGSVIFPYNQHLTGDPLKLPYSAYYEQYYEPNVNALGFGPDRGFNWATDPLPGHTPAQALLNADFNVFATNVELFGWSTGSLLIVGFLFFCCRKRREDVLLYLSLVVVVAVLSLYWFCGGPDFGARYWYLMLVPLLVLTVRGIERLEEKLGSEEGEGSMVRVRAAVLLLGALALVNFFPWRAVDKYYHYRGGRPDMPRLAEEHGFGRSLVLVRGSYDDYVSTFNHNPVDFRGDVPLYAWDKSPEVLAELVAAYADRPFWIVHGPSRTGRGFEVIEGPIEAREALEGGEPR